MLVGTVRTVLIALACVRLPQNPAAPQPVTPENQAPSTAEHRMTPGAKDYLAIILQSGSTNARAYKLVIHHDGSVMAEISQASSLRKSQPARSHLFPPATIDTRALGRLLQEIGDVSKIPTGGCAKSDSFGTRTQIVYAGRTSGDLQCIRQQGADGDQVSLQASKDLSKFVQTTLESIKNQ